MAKSRVINFGPEEMNIRFIDFWEKLIPKALENGDISSEMDLGFIMRKHLWSGFVDGNNYRCYQDITLLPDSNKQKRAEYDLVILHYPEGTIKSNKRKHHPVIAAEFKLWKDWPWIEHDLNKLDSLLDQENHCAVHSMSILDIKTDKSFNKLCKRLEEYKRDGWDISKIILYNPSDIIELQTEFSQWNRYKDFPYNYNWYPKRKDGSIKNPQRKLIMLRLSKAKEKGGR